MASTVYMVRFGSDNPATYTGLSPTFTKFFNSAGSATTAPSISEIASSGMYSFSYEPTGFIGFIMDGSASMPSGIRYVSGVLNQNDGSWQIGVTLQAIGVSIIAQGSSLTAQGVSITAQGVSLLAQGVSISAQGVSILAWQGFMGTSITALGTSISAMGVSLTAQGNTIATLGGVGPSLSALGATVLGIGETLLGMGVTLGAMGTSLGVIMTSIGTTASSFGDSSTDPGTLFGYLKRLQELGEGNATVIKATGVESIYSRGSSYLLRTKTFADTASEVTKT